MSGYYTGMMDLHYAIMTTQDTATTAAVYGTPAVVCKGVNVTITPTYREGKRYASNAMVRNVRKIDSYGVKFAGDTIEHDTLLALLGRTEDTNKVQKISGTDTPPNIALGMALTLDDGTQELWWLYKGTLSEMVISAKTEEGSIEYKDKELEGTFVRRMNDDALAAMCNSGADGLGSGVAAGWFEAVYETPAPGEP